MNKKLPLVSIFKVYANARRILKNPLPFHRENFEKYGDTFAVQINFGKKRSVFTRDREFAQHILQKNQRKYYKSKLQTEDLAKYIGNGLLTSNGDFWKQQRRLIQPAFHKKKLETLLSTIRETIIKELENYTSDSFLDIYPYMSDLAFKVVAKALFNTEMENEIKRLQYITESAQQMLIKELRQPYKKWWFNLNGSIEKNIRLTDKSRVILNRIIERRKNSGKEHDDLLDMLLNARYDDGSAMSNKQLIDEILVLFTAGHETTANALTFTLALLAKHPDSLQKVYNETIAVHKKHSDPLMQVKSLSYTKQCIEEAMRLYPPAYITDRVNIEDDEFNGVKYPKNTLMLISFYELHRNKDFWVAPDTFNPDRFNTEHKKEHSGWYFPFGAGPRMCIGNNFAMYEMILAVSEIVKQFHLSLRNEEIDIKPLITMRPENIYLKFNARSI